MEPPMNKTETFTFKKVKLSNKLLQTYPLSSSCFEKYVVLGDNIINIDPHRCSNQETLNTSRHILCLTFDHEMVNSHLKQRFFQTG